MENVKQALKRAISVAEREEVLCSDEIALLNKLLNNLDRLETLQSHLALASVIVEDLMRE